MKVYTRQIGKQILIIEIYKEVVKMVKLLVVIIGNIYRKKRKNNMNFNLDLFEKTEGKEFGEFTPLALGGHEIKILEAGEYTSESSGKTSLKITVDIAGNDEQAGYFQRHS